MRNIEETRKMVAKAKALLKAADTLAAEYLAEGRAQDAAKVYEVFGTMRVSSLARLHDIIKKARD